MTTGKLRHIAIAVKDPERAAEFYTKAFGLKRVGISDWANAQGVYLSDGVINIALLRYKTEAAMGEEHAMDYQGLHHIGFWVDDVAAARKAVEEGGARYWMGQESKDTTAYYEIKYRDPNGQIFDITESGWLGASAGPEERT